MGPLMLGGIAAASELASDATASQNLAWRFAMVESLGSSTTWVTSVVPTSKTVVIAVVTGAITVLYIAMADPAMFAARVRKADGNRSYYDDASNIDQELAHEVGARVPGAGAEAVSSAAAVRGRPRGGT
jgi:hypothetical protein